MSTEHDHVLVKPGGQKTIDTHHLPDPDNPDEPKCNPGDYGTGDYARKKPEQVPHTDACKNCTGEADTSSSESPQLASKLRRIGEERETA